MFGKSAALQVSTFFFLLNVGAIAHLLPIELPLAQQHHPVDRKVPGHIVPSALQLGRVRDGGCELGIQHGQQALQRAKLRSPGHGQIRIRSVERLRTPPARSHLGAYSKLWICLKAKCRRCTTRSQEEEWLRRHQL